MNTSIDKQNQQERPRYVFQRSEDGSMIPRATMGSNVHAELPPAVYSLQFHEKIGMYLRPEMEFQVPERVYGEVTDNVDRFLRSYELNDKNLGTLLVGDAGSGKTMTLKKLAKKCIDDMQMPVILVNEKFSSDMLLGFFATITQQCMVAFDEIDKVYITRNDSGNANVDSQTAILQLLDGTATSPKKLFVLTANTMGLISDYLKDRPSRIRYTIHFSRMERSAMVDYVSTNLVDYTDEHLRAFVHLALSDGAKDRSTQSDGINFDLMREMVVEMNQFKCNLNKASEFMMLNGTKSFQNFEVTEFIDGVAQPIKFTANASSEGAYMGVDKIAIRVKALLDLDTTKDTDAAWKSDHFKMNESHFVRFGDELDVLVFQYGGREYHLRYNTFSAYQDAVASLDFKTSRQSVVDGRSRAVLAGDEKEVKPDSPSGPASDDEPASGPGDEFVIVAR